MGRITGTFTMAAPAALALSLGALQGHAHPLPVISWQQRTELAWRPGDEHPDAEPPHRHELEAFHVAPAVTAPMTFIATSPQQLPEIGGAIFPAVRA